MTTAGAEQGWLPEITFGARLALVRQRFGWNVKEAALACDLPVQSWRGWERDNMRPRDYLNVCRQIAEATGASYDWLLDGRRTVTTQGPPDGGNTAHNSDHVTTDSEEFYPPDLPIAV